MKNNLDSIVEKLCKEYDTNNTSAIDLSEELYNSDIDESIIKNKNPTNILFLNHTKEKCGVYNYGKRIYDIWKKSNNYNFIYKEVGNLDDYLNIDFNNYKIIIYNYCGPTMPWLTNSTITKKCFNIGMLHESYGHIFDSTIDVSGDVPRPIFDTIPTTINSTNDEIINFLNYGINDSIPIISSFGFGYQFKGFDKIIKYANEQFEKVIIKIIMPFNDFGDSDGINAKYVANLCNVVNTNPNIKLMIIHDFLDDNDILYFLNKSTINIFLYDTQFGRGFSSTIDFALSVNVPLGISDSYMFRHIYNDEICVYKNYINNIIQKGTNYVIENRNKYSHQININFIDSYLKGKECILNTHIDHPDQSILLSDGKILDKISILDVKTKYISSINDIIKQIKEYNDKFTYIKNKYILYYNLLVFVNTIIWNLKENISKMNASKLEYITYYHLIDRYNKSRNRLKNIISKSTDNSVNNNINIHIDEENNKTLKNIIYCILHYDIVTFTFDANISNKFISKIKTLFPTIKNNDIYESTIEIDFSESFNFLLSKFIDNYLIGILDPIIYKGDGKLGDFILQLSVINENFIKTGRKGILYLGNQIDLSCSIEKTYSDSYSLIMKQPYILDYQIWNDEAFDINLSSWRQNYLLYKTTWYGIFKSQYQVEWGKHPWLTVKKNRQFEDKIVIAFTNKAQLNIRDVLSQYDISNVYLVGYSDENKKEFLENFGYNLPFIKCTTIEDMAIVINSCKLFISMMSSPLTLAQGCHHNTLALLGSSMDTVHNMLNDYLPTYKYII